MGFRGIVDLYRNHSVACTGMKGCGKDMLTGNVIKRRKLPYVSNVSYGGEHIELNFEDMLIKNNWRNLVYSQINAYSIPYPELADVYISDAGIYLPAQYCNELNRALPDLATFVAVQRHLNNGKTHYNCQNLNRVYDKIREMCDVYIYCEWCKVFFGKIVIQSVIVYDKAESCQSRIRPPHLSSHGLVPSREAETQKDIYLDNFYNTHGTVKRKLLIYINRAEYDTRHFKKLFEKGVINNEN